MNIEKTISEHAVSDILTPMLESQDRIVTEDVAPLFDQATGLDTPPASGTVTTTIEESRSVITAIIRKAWTATLTMLGGASVISYIAAAYTYLRTRLQGNETYGIPDRRSEISASSPLAANLALLNDRKISGVPEAEDGMSFVHLLGDTTVPITEITDSNYGWAIGNGRLSTILTLLPTVTKATVGCDIATRSLVAGCPTIKELYFPNLRIVGEYNSGYVQNDVVYSCAEIEKIDLPSLEEWYPAYDGGFGSNCPKLEEINAPHLKTVRPTAWFYARIPHALYMATALRKIIVGTPQGYFNLFTGTKSMEGCDNLIHLEIGGDGGFCAMSLSIDQWNPTNALDASRTDLIEEGSTAQNNLEQFLKNFRTYIALRLATFASNGPTLTLSQAVYDAIKDESHLFVFDEGTMTIYAYLTNIKHWTVTK